MTERIRIALDAMGGDHPEDNIPGAMRAQAELGLDVVLVGRAAELEAALVRHGVKGRLEVIEAAEVVAMDEHPAMAIRQKRNASVTIAHRLVAEGNCHAAVSAGNSGAALAAAIFVLGRIPGVQRPALGSLLPTARGQTYILDVGANVDCKPEWIQQFAAMGSAYARRLMDVKRPRVGLLSNGEEAGKGPELVQRTHDLLVAHGIPGAEFAGNVEGKDIAQGVVDVVVTDGFTGNVAIKAMEGTAAFLFGAIRQEAMASIGGRIGGALLRPRLRRVLARADWREFGGAPLLGVRGVSVVAHGRSDALAIRNACRVGAEAVRGGLVETITAEMGIAPHAADAL
ncbi:MAG: phosphate acyltransferase PlsX [Candidatus Dormibacteria bacterium]